MADLQSMAYAPGTLREYETIYILKPDTVSDTISEVNTRVRGIIETAGGKVVKVDNWGRRRLAYEVRKQLKGIYLYWQYLGSPEVVAEFERNLRMLDPVIRYMTVRIEADIDPTARPTDISDEDYERAAITAVDDGLDSDGDRGSDRDYDDDGYYRGDDDDDDDDRPRRRRSDDDDKVSAASSSTDDDASASSAASDSAASSDEGAASSDEGAASSDEGAASSDEGAASSDEGAASSDEGAASSDEGAASSDEGAASSDDSDDSSDSDESEEE